MVSYDEHADFLARQIEGFDAELHGFRQATLGPCLTWSAVPSLQARFEQGYRDGQAKLAQNALRKGGEEQ